ncbi:conserved hypothetical membrane protein [Azoarcus olearius]|uniref:Conserved hypothetical membrane protein n=2 Tax=Azoarcus sp. (strain BH72) TaxID=418699 RepID=A1K2N3_AZOSB|nr:conserved hypothetical membrane protein [Azoarcus olearius]
MGAGTLRNCADNTGPTLARQIPMTFDFALLLFWLKKLVAAFVLPPLLPLVLGAAGLLLLRRRRRLGLALAWSGIAAGLLLSTPASVSRMLVPLEPTAVVDMEAARGAQAIVILGGGRRSHAAEYGGDTVNRLTLERLRYGARLARATGLPLLVSGGAPSGDVPEATLMAAALREDFGIAPRWEEGGSFDTRDNARLSAAMLRADGVTRVVLVTHAAHMRRAEAEFALHGLAVVPAPTAWLGPGPERADDDDEVWPSLPSQGTAYAGWYALHEWMGLLAYRLSR